MREPWRRFTFGSIGLYAIADSPVQHLYIQLVLYSILLVLYKEKDFVEKASSILFLPSFVEKAQHEPLHVHAMAEQCNQRRVNMVQYLLSS